MQVKLQWGGKYIDHINKGHNCRLIDCTWTFRESHPEWDIIKPINIGNNVYIGTNCIILPGVTIGNNVIIGAGSIVSKDIPSDSVYAGVPARFIKTTDDYLAKIKNSVHNTKLMSWQDKKAFYTNLFKA